jgi:lysophospholipase L1-like esterase
VVSLKRVFKIAAARVAGNSYYVALGSSFAAGLGLGEREPGSPFVSQRSVNGYPQQLARMLGVPSFTDMSSSGATIRHVLNGGQMMMGPQIAALGPDTRLVTLTAGGNDVSYVGDIMMMAYQGRKGILGRLVGGVWKGPKPLGERKFPDLESDFRATLSEIKRRSPHARIVVVTYPVIFPSEGTCAKLGLTEDQAALMRGVGEKLAEITRAAAREAGATLVDMAELSVGHDACSAKPWVNGLGPETGAGFHPTQAGAKATAEAIAHAVRAEKIASS